MREVRVSTENERGGERRPPSESNAQDCSRRPGWFGGYSLTPHMISETPGIGGPINAGCSDGSVLLGILVWRRVCGRMCEAVLKTAVNLSVKTVETS